MQKSLISVLFQYDPITNCSTDITKLTSLIINQSINNKSINQSDNHPHPPSPFSFSASTIVTQICAKSRSVRYHNECRYKQIPAGHATACYCDTDMCNAAPTTLRHASTYTVGFVVAVAVFVVNTIVNRPLLH